MELAQTFPPTFNNAMEHRGRNNFSDVAVENAIQDLKRIQLKEFDNDSLARPNNNCNFSEEDNNNNNNFDDNGNVEIFSESPKVSLIQSIESILYFVFICKGRSFRVTDLYQAIVRDEGMKKERERCVRV